MEFKSYGIAAKSENFSDLDIHLEELDLQGYTILPNVIEEEMLKQIRERLDRVYAKQEETFGKENLKSIRELNVARCLLAADDFFLDLAAYPIIIDIIKRLLGDYFVLHLQNGIINRPQQEHHQSSWHRDLPYQDYVVSKPLGINAFWCIDRFVPETGSTVVLPHSHQIDHLPSQRYVEKHSLQIEAPAGAVVLFNSMLYHRAGYNSSNQIRRGINHVYVVPILKQQIDLPQALNGKYKDDPFLSKLLGYQSKVLGSVDEYRQNRLNRK